MLAAGVTSLADVDDLGLLGLPIRDGPRLLALLARLHREVHRLRPDVVVSVDSPSLFLRWVRGLPFPKLHWVSPQLWAWRARRAARVARSVDTLTCLLPFEPGLYRGTPVRARFTGHPAAAGHVQPLGRKIGLVAGSRRRERERLGPLFRSVLQGFEVIEAVPEGLPPVLPEAERVTGAGALGGKVRGALVCSGTASLELAVAGVPQVVAYAVPAITRAVARRMLHVDAVSLPNLVLGRRVVPEHLGNPDAIALRRSLACILAHPEEQRRGADELRQLLQPDDAVARVAHEVRRLAHGR